MLGFCGGSRLEHLSEKSPTSFFKILRDFFHPEEQNPGCFISLNIKETQPQVPVKALGVFYDIILFLVNNETHDSTEKD